VAQLAPIVLVIAQNARCAEGMSDNLAPERTVKIAGIGNLEYRPNEGYVEHFV
jgi:hypothetical protein